MRNISFVREKTTKNKTFYYSYLKFSLVFFFNLHRFIRFGWAAVVANCNFNFLSHHPIFSKIEKKEIAITNVIIPGYDINHNIKPNLTM